MQIRYPITGGLLAAVAMCGAAEAAAREQVRVQVSERTLIVEGTARADTIALRVSPANPNRVAVDVDDDGVADQRIRRDRFDRIVVLAHDGADAVRIVDSVAFTFTEPITIEGGAGDDALTGGRSDETFVGGAGDDVVDGGPGADVASLGAGADGFAWAPGDGSDIVDGQGDRDELTFTGSGAAERFDVSAAGRRVRFERDVAAVTMDLGGLERIRTNALGGPDTFTVSPLGGTGVSELDVDLAGEPSGAAGDAEDDAVVVSATNRGDTAAVLRTRDGAVVSGLSASVRLRHTDPDDGLTVNTLGGEDSVDASTLRADSLRLTVDGGDGPDTLVGGAGDDLLLGGVGTDVAEPNGGDDVALLGDNADVFRWNPRDGSDTVEGQDGRDTLELIGSAAAERFVASANGQRVRLTRNVGAVELDLNDVENLEADVLGGTDTLTINDLTGTGVTNVVADLAADAQSDTVVVKGTSAPDNIGLSGANGTVNVTGLQAAVRIDGAESTRDTLDVRGLGGADTFDPTALAPNTIGFTFTQ